LTLIIDAYVVHFELYEIFQ